MNKMTASGAALLIAMAPTFAVAQDASDEVAAEIAAAGEDVILIGPEVRNATTIAAGAAGLLALALLLDGTSSTTTTTTGQDNGGSDN